MEQPDDDLGLQTVGGISWSVTLLGRGERVTSGRNVRGTTYHSGVRVSPDNISR